MTNSLDLSTPPPLTIRTPNTPQFGFYDNYKPFSPRRSARLAQRQLLYRKAVAPSCHEFYSNCTPSQRSVNLVTSNNNVYPTPAQKLSGKNVTGNSGSNIIRKNQYVASTNETSADSAQSLDFTIANETVESAHDGSSSSRNNNMLPTPAKTPVKRPLKPSSSITSIARNLFPAQSSRINDLISTPRRNGHTKIKSEKLGGTGRSERIEVYTDPHDRIPERDSCPSNPFHVDASTNRSQLQGLSKKRRKVTVPGEGIQTIEEIERRNDGLLYVFRGKKVWRKFSEDNEDDDVETTDNGIDDTETNLHKPLTRSSIKPRLLFPKKQVTQPQELISQDVEDEEAETDIEDSVLCSQSFRAKEVITTPKNSSFVPASPPSTVRVTRSKMLNLEKCLDSHTDYNTGGTNCDISRNTNEDSPSYNYHSKLRSMGATKKREGEHYLGSGKKMKLR